MVEAGTGGIKMDIIEVRRAGFEKAMTSEGYSQLEWMGNHYRCDDIDDMWRGFKLALDSVVVELPGYIGLGQAFTGTPMAEIRAHNHFNDAITQCKKAINAAGVRTK